MHGLREVEAVDVPLAGVVLWLVVTDAGDGIGDMANWAGAGCMGRRERHPARNNPGHRRILPAVRPRRAATHRPLAAAPDRTSPGVPRLRTTILLAALHGLAAALAQAGVFAADPVPGPVKVTPNGHYLLDRDGQPFFYLGDTAWELSTG